MCNIAALRRTGGPSSFPAGGFLPRPVLRRRDPSGNEWPPRVRLSTALACLGEAASRSFALAWEGERTSRRQTNAPLIRLIYSQLNSGNAIAEIVTPAIAKPFQLPQGTLARVILGCR